MALAGYITRAELGLANLQLVTAGTYDIDEDGIRAGARKLHRKIVSSVLAEGGTQVGKTPTLTTGKLTMLVLGTTNSAVRANLLTLTAAFDQPTFDVYYTLNDGSQHAYRCLTAEWGDWAWDAPFLFGGSAYKVARITFTFPRQPTALVGI